MKERFLVISAMFIFSLTSNLYAQTHDFSLSVAVNSIYSQIEVPIAATPGQPAVIDANGNWTVSGDEIDNSLSLSIIPKYSLNDEMSLRFELGITNISTTNHYDSQLANYPDPREIHDQAFNEKIYRFNPGIEWSFFKRKRVASYCGLSASYIKYGTSNYNMTNVFRDANTDTLSYSLHESETMPGGYAAGISVLTGCSFYLQKHISFGAEITASMLYYNIGGETTNMNGGYDEQLPVPSYSATDTYSSSFKGFRISKLMCSFNITYWINRKIINSID